MRVVKSVDQINIKQYPHAEVHAEQDDGEEARREGGEADHDDSLDCSSSLMSLAALGVCAGLCALVAHNCALSDRATSAPKGTRVSSPAACVA